MLFVGDVHGKWKRFDEIVKQNPEKNIVQLGDFGVGFNTYDIYSDPRWGHKVNFVRGNHDNPSAAKVHPNYLGNYGIYFKGKVGYISGAWSIDSRFREASVNWWMDEQLSQRELDKGIQLIKQYKPEIIVSHDGPEVFAKQLVTEHFKTVTGKALSQLFEEYQPKHWIIGHYHKSYSAEINGTQFRCLDELETFELEI